MAELGHASYEGLQELKGRLPHVPETVIMHFLSQLGGNIEQCYEELKDRKWNEDDLHRPPEDLSSLLLGDPRMRTVSEVTPRTNTTVHPHLKRMMTYPEQNTPPDSNQYGLQNTWSASANWDSRTSRPPGGLMAYGGISPTYPSGFSFLRSAGSPGSPSMHSFGPLGLPSMHSNSPPGLPHVYSSNSPPGLQHVTTAAARHHPVSQNPLTDVLTIQQRRQLEHIQKIRENLVHQLSMLKSEADDKKHRLTKLRLEVSEGPTIIADTLSFMVAGFHTSGYFMTWLFWYLAEHPAVQERLVEEVEAEVGGECGEKLKRYALNPNTYMRQVQDETLRVSTLGVYAAHYSDKDIAVDGYSVPAGTPIIQALGVALKNETQWEDVHKFDPDHFAPGSPHARRGAEFCPFGTNSPRKCPGYQFSYFEVTVFTSILLHRFNLVPVEGQNVEQVHGLVTEPKEEIRLYVRARE